MPVQANRCRARSGAIALLFAVSALPWPLAGGEGRAVDPSVLRSGIRLAGEYLVRVCDSNGRFEYVRHSDPFRRPRPSYNILRHAGAMYALADYHRWSADPAALAAVERAAGFLRSRCVRPVEGISGALAIWSGASIDGDSGPARAKLGGAGLALVGLTNLEALKPGSVPREEMAAIGRFILFLQREDGFFVKGFTPSKGGKDDDWQSLFYPGEAVLGLSMLFEIDGDVRWRDAAVRGLKFLATSRRGQVPPADHWALIATARLLEKHTAGASAEDQASLLSHARDIVRAMLDDRDDIGADPLLQGSWGKDGRTTPTATRLEGLLAIMDLASKDDPAMRKEVEAVVEHGIAFLLRSQFREGILVGGIPKSVLQAQPGADPMAGEVRIDYVQHALSALIQYARRLRITSN